MANFTEIFETRKNDSRWNTSYPLSPDDWNIYRVPEELSFSEEELSFYIPLIPQHFDLTLFISS